MFVSASLSIGTYTTRETLGQGKDPKHYCDISSISYRELHFLKRIRQQDCMGHSCQKHAYLLRLVDH